MFSKIIQLWYLLTELVIKNIDFDNFLISLQLFYFHILSLLVGQEKFSMGNFLKIENKMHFFG